MTSTALSLVGIVRVSAVRGRGGDSFISTELQLSGIRAWVEAHPDYVLPDHLISEELDVSGARPLERMPALRRAVELVEAGDAAGIIGVRLNRLARSPEVYGEIKRRVLAAGGVVVAVDEGGIRDDEPETELADDMSQSFGKYEVGRARKVFRIARSRAASRGVATFAAPAGYDRIDQDDDTAGPRGGLKPNRDAAAISEAFRMRAAGSSYTDIAAFLTARGVRPRKGRPGVYTNGWSRSGVTHLLRNRVYLGELSGGETVNAQAHEPIVDVATFTAAQRSQGARPSRESRHGFWLTRVTRCASCDAAMVGVMAHPHGRDKPAHGIYRCQTTGCSERPSIGANRLEAHVEQHLLGWLRDAGARVEASVAITPSSELGELEVRREQLEREVEAWRRMPVADLDPVFYSDGLRERLRPLEDTLARIGEIRASAGTRAKGLITAALPDDWNQLDADARRVVAREALARVVVLRGGASVPLDERISVVFAE